MKNKSTLAKLMSEEDINVVYKQMETAYFNSKKRELGLPIWNDEEMSDAMHDLMVGHEIGHALWTPLDMLEEAHVRGINHSFVNIIEDVRIERFAKRKYPGLLGVFKRGYSDLIAKDFFGTKERGIETFGFIDRINVFYKTGDKSIPFSEKEMPFVERAAKVETEKEVLDLAEEIYKFMEENPEANGENSEDNSDKMPSAETGDNEENTDGAGVGDQNGADDSNRQDSDESTPNGSTTDSSAENSEGDEETDEEGNLKGVDANSDTDGDDGDDVDGKTEFSSTEGGVGPSNGAGVPVAETDDIGKSVLDKLRDTDARDRNYGSIPKVDSSKFTIGYKKILEVCNTHYAAEIAASNQNSLYSDKILEEIEAIKKDNKKTVAYMVKEFEMKKSADAYARAAVSKTGTLDMGKLHTYKYNEDLFRKVTTLPGATNHGMVMIVDWSGSMHDNLKSTMIQTMNLVWFCRRAKIPFRVLAFSDAVKHTYREDIPQKFKAGDIILRDFRLLEYFSSDMTLAEETKMFHNIMMMIERYSRSYRDWSESGYPYNEPDLIRMGGTPLNDAIIVAMDLGEKFKVDAGVQKIHTVFLTDGASNSIAGKYDYGFNETKNEHYEIVADFGRGWGREENIITDPVTNKKYKVTGALTDTLLKVLKNRVYGMNVIGFFIAGTGRSGRIDKRTISHVTKIPTWDDEMKSILRKVNKEKFYAVEGDVTGYDEYYLLPGGSTLDVENAGLDDKLVGASKAKLKSAFGKSMKGKITSRVLLNRFIKLVA